MEDYIRDEYDEQNLTAEYIIEMLGQEITFYELWEAGEDPFLGKAKVNSLKKDENGQIRILAETVWGSDLNQAYLNGWKGRKDAIHFQWDWFLLEKG